MTLVIIFNRFIECGIKRRESGLVGRKGGKKKKRQERREKERKGKGSRKDGERCSGAGNVTF